MDFQATRVVRNFPTKTDFVILSPDYNLHTVYVCHRSSFKLNTHFALHIKANYLLITSSVASNAKRLKLSL